jgi:hypothetical protein
MKFEFSRQIFEKSSVSNFMKIHPVGAELFHADKQADGWTDPTDTHDEVNNRFPQFRERA